MFHHIFRRSVLSRLFVLLPLIAVLLASAGSVDAAPGDPSFEPLLTRIQSSATNQGEITVLGANFTPGGDVFVAIYDRWGNQVHETRWTTASGDTPAINGTNDPSQGFHPGGVVFETFTQLCEQPAMVRAYDQQTNTWSNLLDIDTDCSA